MSALPKPKANLLVIDDEQIVHDSIQRILEDEGYQVDGALRVKEALSRLAEKKYDLVLTDLMMPDDSGMKAVEAVARDHPYCGVVMFTGFATVESAVQSMKLGALDYLPKPFTPEELVEVTEKALAKVFKARRDQEIEVTFSDAEKALKSSLDLIEILNLICSSVVRLLKMKGSALFMYNPKDKSLSLMSSRGLSQEYLDKGALDATEDLPQLVETGQPVLVEEAQFDASLHYPQEAKKEGVVAILSVPLKVKDSVLGVLRLYSAEKPSLDADETDILMKFAEQATRAVENAMAYEKVRSDIEGIKKHIPGARAETNK